MKNLKKWTSILLALVMALALAVPAFAEGNEVTDPEQPPTTADVTVPSLDGHTFTAYQIFSGTQSENKGALADVEWGSGIDHEEFLRNLVALGYTDDEDNNVFNTGMSAAEAADAIAAYASYSEQANAIAKAAYAAKTTGTEFVEDTTELATGYYIIVDTTSFGEDDTDTFVNAALLRLTDDITLEIKVDIPHVDKQVQENDNTGDADNGYDEAADYSIGDTVPFKFISAVPDMTQFDTYKYVFHDKMDVSLDFNVGSVVVTIGGTTVQSGYTIQTGDDVEDDCTFEIVFTDLKSVVETIGADKDDEIVITFNATLNSDAVIGISGNKNEVYLEYSNNPNDEGTGNTPKDEVLVFTYELDTTKVNPEGKALEDAQFHLSREVTDSSGSKVTEWAVVEDNRLTGWVRAETGAEGYVAADADGNLNGVAYAGTTLTSDDKGLFVVEGLDAGTYKLLETKAPDGYNTPKDPFTIVISRNLVQNDGAESYEDLAVTLNGVGSENIDKANGKLPISVENRQGSTLPETGGIGTTIFYGVGGVLVVAAVVLLVTKKRMSTKD